MKDNDIIDNILRGVLLNKNLKINIAIAASRILYNFFSHLDIKKDSKLVKKEILKQIKNQPLSALTVSFVVGMTLASLIRRRKH